MEYYSQKETNPDHTLQFLATMNCRNDGIASTSPFDMPVRNNYPTDIN